MDKGSDDLTVVTKEALALFNAGKYRKALPKFMLALSLVEKAGDEQEALHLYTWVIGCHAHLAQVSGVECEGNTDKLTFFRSLSMWECCVCATSWKR